MGLGKVYLLIPVAGLSFGLWGQTTQGMIFGQISDSLSGNGVPGARVIVSSRISGIDRVAASDSSGRYVLPLLSPGIYRIRVEHSGYQNQELHELRLTVGASLTLSFRLRPGDDVWEARQRKSVFLPGNSVLPFYGPDVDTSRTGNFEADSGIRGVLESTISQVITPVEMLDLPLAGRDIYALLITVPGVTTDSATGRGLGLTANGQRPSSANFLLDGLENNNYLISGPLTTIAPEAIDEYRISTNNFSAEYGRTSGFLANAVTRSGGDAWHGLGYFYTGNDVLDANEFQRNLRGLGRTPLKDMQPGFSVSGPAPVRGLFASASFEYLRFRSADAPQPYQLLSSTFIAEHGSFAAGLLKDYRGPVAPGRTAIVTLSPPDSLNRSLALPRLDYVFGAGAQRLTTRLALMNLKRPDFLWSPYPDFSSPLIQKAVSFASAWLAAVRPNLTNEARLGISGNDLRFDRARPNIPVLTSGDGTLLPSSTSAYSYRNQTQALEVLDNVVWVRDKHLFKFGAGVLRRALQGYMNINDGYYAFESLDEFAAGAPERARIALDPTALARGQYLAPDPQREYSYHQLNAFAQDSYRIHPRLVLNYGLRYDYFGPPASTGATKDTVIRLGAGSSLAAQLPGAALVAPPAGNQTLYRSEKDDWGVRLGLSYSLRNNTRTVVRGAFGTFYDRPFDNLWQNIRANSFVLSTSPFAGHIIVPIAGLYPTLTNLVPDRDFSRFYLFPPVLRAPRVQSYFLGIEHQLTRSMTLTASAPGSWGHDLLTTDLVNRDLYNHVLSKNIAYRSNDGLSYYSGLAVSTRYQTGRALFSLTYTRSHSIDNQSEPLRGEFFDLLGTQAGAGGGSGLLSTFSRQFDWQADRGNSDFDQRHNLVFYSTWESPHTWRDAWTSRLARDWRFSQLMGIHSGLPFTVTSGSTGDAPPNASPIYNRRADLVNPALIYSGGAAVPGGVRILNPMAFAPSAASRQGTLGRNSLAGPGFYSLDVSLARSFAMACWGESRRLTLRADAFNVFNHANLGTPVTSLGGQFGEAQFQRTGLDSTFPALIPLIERSRQVQFLLRFQF